jgi:hypothetical protein
MEPAALPTSWKSAMFTSVIATVFGRAHAWKAAARVTLRRPFLGQWNPAQIRITWDSDFSICTDSNNYATGCGRLAGVFTVRGAFKPWFAPNQDLIFACKRLGQALTLFRYLRKSPN